MSRRALYTVVAFAALFVAYQIGKIAAAPPVETAQIPQPVASTPPNPAPVPPPPPPAGLPAPLQVTPLTPAPAPANAPQPGPAGEQLEVVWFAGGSRAALGTLINHSAHPVTVRLLARTIVTNERSGFHLNPTEAEVPAQWGEHLDRTTTTIAPGQYDSFALQGVSVRTIPSGIVIRDAAGNELPYSEKPPTR
jgi:hypothetical protein